MTIELVEQEDHRFRSEIPREWRGEDGTNLDLRLMWLWNQRFGTVQTIYLESPDVLDKTACVPILSAIMAGDLDAITQVLRRIEGGPLPDEVYVDDDEPMPI